MLSSFRFCRIFSISISILIFCSAYVFGATDTTQVPSIPPIHESQLSNGLKIRVVEHSDLPVVALRIAFYAGAAIESPECAGISGLTLRSMTSCTQNRSAEQLSETLNYLGTSIDYTTGWDVIGISCLSLKWDLDTIMDVFSDVILSPSFDSRVITTQKQELLADLKYENDDASIVATKNLKELLFGSHPYGQPLLGSVASVNRISANDVREFYKEYLVPNNAVLIVVGDINEEEILSVITTHFEGWTRGQVPVVENVNSSHQTSPAIRLIHDESVTIPRIQLGHIGCDKFGPDYEAALVTNYILGGNILSSRLMTQLKNQQSLVDLITSEYDIEAQQCPFIVSTRTNPENIVRVFESVIQEMKTIQTEPISEQELSDARDHFLHEYAAQLETPLQIAEIIGEFELLGIDFQKIRDFPKKINALTLTDIQHAANEYLNPDRLKLVVVGDKNTIAEELRTLDDVELVDPRFESGISAMRTILKKKSKQ